MPEVIQVAKTGQIREGNALCVEAGGKKIAVFNVKGKFYAIDDECSHAGGSLSEGPSDGCEVTCPWHGATFDVTNGKATGEPAEEGVVSYKVLIEGDDIRIEI